MQGQDKSLISKDSMKQQQKKKKNRRPRSAAGERNYLCGCNKAYLSYPALYTHVKNKHGGVFPIGSNARRKILKNEEDDIEENFIPNIDQFYQEFETFTQDAKGNSLTKDKTLTQLTIENIFSSLKQKDPLLEKTMKLSLLQDDKNDKNLTIVQAFSNFLFEIYPYCKESFFQEYVCLILMFIQSLEEHGSYFVGSEDKQQDFDEDKIFCETKNVLVISKMTNLFIAEHFPKQMKQFQDNDVKFQFLGEEDDHIKNLILMCKFLSNWFFHKKISQYKMEINVDF